ncbi:hypothetical protein M569_10544 [Genlisea aurea]|uniref:F-box domain-containing protein n=1 Tax=Genlisea aurea TaxID=192259 RepID=S8DWB9_9LAMI|nr:hypothetical protein M569_10544 [Genlisea aurea]
MAQELGEDRISGLPNDILHKILSLLHIKSVAQTCVLSKRWRSLWLTFPDLDFTTVESLARCADIGGSAFASNTAEDVLGIERLLLKRNKENSILRLFKLRTVLSFASLRRLIECAVALDVQKLDIDVDTSDYFNFPCAVLLDKRLLSLRLRSENHEIKLPSAEVIQRGFQSLTAMSLTRGDFNDEPSLVNIFTDPFFPSLKTLTLELCSGIKNLKVQLSNLLDLAVVHIKSLVVMELNSKKLENLRVDRSFTSTERAQVLLSSPSLKEVIWFRNNVVENFIIDNLTNLQKVTLLNNDTELNVKDLLRGTSQLKLKDFIAGISHCHYLFICGPFIELIPQYKPFKCLTTLTMQTFRARTNISAEALTFFLRSSPAIEDLTIVSRGPWSSETPWNWDSASVESSLRHLKILVVDRFTRAADDVEFVRFVLKNATVLERVSLHSTQTDINENVRNEVRGFRRASPKCDVQFRSLEHC